jgi:hypothetical protein
MSGFPRAAQLPSCAADELRFVSGPTWERDESERFCYFNRVGKRSTPTKPDPRGILLPGNPDDRLLIQVVPLSARDGHSSERPAIAFVINPRFKPPPKKSGSLL